MIVGIAQLKGRGYPSIQPHGTKEIMEAMIWRQVLLEQDRGMKRLWMNRGLGSLPRNDR